MTISLASLHAQWDRHRDKPKHLFMLIVPEHDPRPYISVAYFTGGWLGAKLVGAPTIRYEGRWYLPLVFVERQRRKIFYSIWVHFNQLVGEEPALLVCPIRG